MTRRTEQFEQEYIDAWIEEERRPSGEPQRKLGKIVLERTEIAQQAFEAVGEI